jgi:hypothetical protein
VTLEAQKTRFLRHISHELKTHSPRFAKDRTSFPRAWKPQRGQREIAHPAGELDRAEEADRGLVNYSAAAALLPRREDRRAVPQSNDRTAIVTRGRRIELNLDHVTLTATRRRSASSWTTCCPTR